MKTALLNHNKRIASNYSWHSSNSARLNQDIMSAKIENSVMMDGPPDMRITTHQGNSSDSQGNKGGDYTIPGQNIMVQKLTSLKPQQAQANKAEIAKRNWIKEKTLPPIPPNKVTVFATVDPDNRTGF